VTLDWMTLDWIEEVPHYGRLNSCSGDERVGFRTVRPCIATLNAVVVAPWLSVPVALAEGNP